MLPIPNIRKDAPHVIYRIPLEFLPEFTDTPFEAMRDLLAIPAVVKDALFPNPRILEERLDKLRHDPIIEENLYRWVNSRIDSPKQFNIFNEHFQKANNHAAYFMHIDLAIAEDATGISLCHRDPGTGRFILDFIIGVESSKCIDKRIPIGRMKYLAIFLKYNMGFNISKVTYDGFQSAESIQELIENGIDAKVQSVDRTSGPYDTLRDIIHSDQLSFYEYKTLDPLGAGKNRSLMAELLNLQKDAKTGRVDHVAKGSKDLSDSLCGAIFTCASQNFEYQGINDLTLERDTLSDSTQAYIYDGYVEADENLSLADLQDKIISQEEDDKEDRFEDDGKFYGDDF